VGTTDTDCYVVDSIDWCRPSIRGVEKKKPSLSVRGFVAFVSEADSNEVLKEIT
jgi:hypothetical protein